MLGSGNGHGIAEWAIGGRRLPSPDVFCSARHRFRPLALRAYRFFALVQPNRPDGLLARSLLEWASEEFFRTFRRSVTGSLNASMLLAHYLLKRENAGRLTQDRARASSLFVAVTDRGAYLAQAGETCAFVVRSGTPHRLPNDLVDSQMANTFSLRGRFLGEGSEPLITFAHIPIGEGDVVFLAAGAAAAVVDEANLAGAFSCGDLASAGARLASLCYRRAPGHDMAFALFYPLGRAPATVTAADSSEARQPVLGPLSRRVFTSAA